MLVLIPHTPTSLSLLSDIYQMRQTIAVGTVLLFVKPHHTQHNRANIVRLAPRLVRRSVIQIPMIFTIVMRADARRDEPA